MSSRTAARIAVLKGGRSAEREVSLVSGRECAAALRQEGFEVVEIDAGPDLASALAAAKPDVVFNALHGRWGEDGCVQGLLEWLAIPYTHSGVLASALAMDKTRAKQVFAAAGLPVARGMIACREHVRAAHPMEPPYVVKPNAEGSSVGVYIVPAGANRPPALADSMPEAGAGRGIRRRARADRRRARRPAADRHRHHRRRLVRLRRQVPPRRLAPRGAGGDSRRDRRRLPRLRAARPPGARLPRPQPLGLPLGRGARPRRARHPRDQHPARHDADLARPRAGGHVGMSFGALVRWLVEDASCSR